MLVRMQDYATTIYLTVFQKIRWKGGTRAVEEPLDCGGNPDQITTGLLRLELRLVLRLGGAEVIVSSNTGHVLPVFVSQFCGISGLGGAIHPTECQFGCLIVYSSNTVHVWRRQCPCCD